MKKVKEEPSVAGLLLLVTGMLLLSVVALSFFGTAGLSGDNGRVLLALTVAAALCLGLGAALSARRRK